MKALRLAHRTRFLSLGLAAGALGWLLLRRRRAAVAAELAALGALAALAPRLYRTELALTRVRDILHVRPAAAAGLLHEQAQVAGAFLDGHAVAYPIAMLARSRPFVDQVGAARIAPIADRQSHAAMALVDSHRSMRLLRLGTLENQVVLYDRATGNAFRPLLGRVEAGPDAGAPLELQPLVRCTFAAWKKLHPECELAWWDAPPAHALLHHLGEHPLTARQLPEEPLSRPLDGRLAPAEEVLGLELGGAAHAFTRRHLRAHPVSELELGGRRVAVLYDHALDIAQAYLAELGGAAIALRPYPGLHAVAQAEDQSLWDVAGRCIRGAHYGASLQPVPHSVDRLWWFAWAHAHPHCGLDAWPAAGGLAG